MRSTRLSASRRLRSDSPMYGREELAGIEGQKRESPARRDGLGGEALAAALDAEQQDASRRIERLFAGRRQESDLARRDPLLQLLEAADLVEPLRRGNELEQPAALDQDLLGLPDPGPVLRGQRLVIDDRAGERALRLEHRQALEVGDDALRLFRRQIDPRPGDVAGAAPDHPLEKVLELGGSRQGELEADLHVLELGARGHRRPDHHEGARGAGELLRRLAEQAQRGRSFEVGRRILEEPRAVPGRLPDQPQGERQLGGLLGIRGMRRRQAARRAPAPERDRQLARNRAHEGLEALFLHRLADDEGMARPKQKRQVLGGDVQTGA